MKEQVLQMAALSSKQQLFIEGFLVFLVLASFMIFINWVAWLVLSLILGLIYASIKHGLKQAGDYIKCPK